MCIPVEIMNISSVSVVSMFIEDSSVWLGLVRVLSVVFIEGFFSPLFCVFVVFRVGVGF